MNNTLTTTINDPYNNNRELEITFVYDKPQTKGNTMNNETNNTATATPKWNTSLGSVYKMMGTVESMRIRLIDNGFKTVLEVSTPDGKDARTIECKNEKEAMEIGLAIATPDKEENWQAYGQYNHLSLRVSN